MGKPPPGALTYENWLAKGRERTGILRSCAWAIAVALAAGPWAILGAFVGTYSYGRADVAGVLGLTIIAPVIEEMMKIAATLYVVERRPFLFQSRAQIVICVIAGGLVFACIENVFYLKVYISDPSAAIIYWRWTVCVFLHMGCSLIAGLGLIRIWQDVWRRRARARIHLAFPYLVIAMVVHGTYNGFALVWSMMEHM
jgi:RsiW-degrading membrane proteinase PrsW (M82 family)